MIAAIRTYVADIFNGRDRAYIYIWLSKEAKAVYVGQTAGPVGTLGRGYAHFLPLGQLRQRLEDRMGVAPEEFSDFNLASYRLPPSQEFIGVETAYREAVEFLVQLHLQERRDLVQPVFRVISWVRTNDRTQDLSVQLLARQIADDFLQSYPSLP